jgi:probable addiction module antidote protein
VPGTSRHRHKTSIKLWDIWQISKRGEAVTMNKPYANHEEATVESLRRAPEFAAEYLSAVLEDGDPGEVMSALRRVSDACGGVAHVATNAEMNAKTLYRTLSPKGNPELKSLMAILSALNLKLAIVPKQ